MITAVVDIPRLNMRSGPGVSYPSVGMLTRGTTINELCTVVGLNGVPWSQLENGNYVCKGLGGIPYIKYLTTEALPSLYRILSDPEAGWEPNGPRPFNRGLKGFPSTVRIEGGKSAMQLPLKWTEYLRTCMSAKAFKYVFKAASGWQNRATFGLVESLTFSGNIVEVLSIEGNRAYIKAIRPKDATPALPITPRPGKLDPIVHLFSIQYMDRLDMSTDGRWAVTLCMVDDNNIRPWIDLRNLKKV